MGDKTKYSLIITIMLCLFSVPLKEKKFQPISEKKLDCYSEQFGKKHLDELSLNLMQKERFDYTQIHYTFSYVRHTIIYEISHYILGKKIFFY